MLVNSKIFEMKYNLTVLLVIIITSLGFSQSEEKMTLNVEFEVTKHQKGQIVFALFNSAESFLKKPLIADIAKVENGTAKFVFSDLPKGTYSFSYYHDLNENKELDTNLIGIPKEPYGFSNNQKGSFGPPSYEEANVLIEKNISIQLKIK